MWWTIAIVAVAVLAFFEWRSRNRPEIPGLRDHWGTHSAARSGRAMTGGHNTDEPRG
jgi:hypothetical protein